MTEDIQNLLRTVEKGARTEIWEAAKQLESISVEMVLSLIHLLESGKQTETRAAAAYVLGFSRFASARTALEQVLDDTEQDASLRGHAAEALAYIGDPRSLGVLIKNLRDSNPGVKYWCAFALGQISDSKAIAALEQMAENVGDQHYDKYSLRAEALDAIGRIKERPGASAPG
jgi:HEAT repeat protein